jgi:predicted deacylase
VEHSVDHIEIAAPSPGTRQEIVVHRFGTAGARPKAYVQAAIHAGETPALLVAHHLQALLEAADVTGEVVLVPAANPIGLAQRVQRRHVGRYDLASGVNFNRGFPDIASRVDELVDSRLGDDPVRNVALVREAAQLALDDLPAAQPSPVLKKTLLRLAIDADIVLDLHCAKHALMHLFVNAGSWPDAADLHADLASEATFLEEETGSGLAFDHATGGLWRELARRHPDRPIPEGLFSATVELRGFSAVDDQTAARDAANLLRFLKRRGVVAGEAGPLPEPLSDPTPLDGVGFVMAPVAGVVVLKTELGSHVREGDVVAEVVDPMAATAIAARTPVLSPTDGLVYEVLDKHYVVKGQNICLIAGSGPVHGQRDNLLLD